MIINYKTPYGIYYIFDTGIKYKCATPVDSTPIPEGDLRHEGGFVIGVDNSPMFVLPTFKVAEDLIKDILLKAHRYVLNKATKTTQLCKSIAGRDAVGLYCKWFDVRMGGMCNCPNNCIYKSEVNYNK